MRWLQVSTLGALLFGMCCAPARAGGARRVPPPPPLVRSFACFDALKHRDLGAASGGPGGSHWNTMGAACEVEVAFPTDQRVEYLEVSASYGQPGAMRPVFLTYVDNPQPLDRWTTTVFGAQTGQTRRQFSIPFAVFHKGLVRPSKDPQSGAQVYRARFVVTVTMRDADLRAVRRDSREVSASFAFGE